MELPDNRDPLARQQFQCDVFVKRAVGPSVHRLMPWMGQPLPKLRGEGPGEHAGSLPTAEVGGERKLAKSGSNVRQFYG